VAIVIGIGSSVLTTWTILSEVQTRVEHNEQDITRLKSMTRADRQAAQEMRERMIRISTKIDLLLKSEGISTDDISQTQ